MVEAYQFIYPVTGGIVLLLLSMNAYFVKRLIEHQDKSDLTMNRLTTSVEVLTSKIETFKFVAEEMPQIKTRLALLESCFEREMRNG